MYKQRSTRTVKRTKIKSTRRIRAHKVRSTKVKYGTKWYKATTRRGNPRFGRGTYDLPVNGKPGAWMVAVGKLGMCHNGYHATQLPQVWCCPGQFGDRLFEVEVNGPADLPISPVKHVFRAVRFVREVKGRELLRLMRRGHSW